MISVHCSSSSVSDVNPLSIVCLSCCMQLSLYQRVNVSATLSDTLPSNGPDLHNGRARKGRPPSLVAGQEHDWVLLQYKLPVPCGYCGGLLKEVHKQGLKCRECKMSIHHKCKKHVPFCSGVSQTLQLALLSRKYMCTYYCTYVHVCCTM